MKRIVLVMTLACLYFPYYLTGQTEEDRAIITQNYDLQKLAQLENEYRMEFESDRQRALELAAINGWEERMELPNGGIAVLVGVYENGNPKYYVTHNREAGITTRTDRVHTGGSAGLDLNGEDMVLAVWDGGRVRSTHPLLDNRVTQIDNATDFSDHATHVSGTMIGTGNVIGGAAKGMAPEATLNAYDVFTDTAEMVAAAANGT